MPLLLRALTGAACAAAIVSAHAMGGHPTATPRVNGSHASAEPEFLLIRTLIEVRNNRLDQALIEVDKVLASHPNFRLAHLIKGDLLLARTRPLTTIGNAPGAPQERLADLRDEARARLARHQHERPVGRVPRYILQLQPDQKHAFIVDASKSTLYVFENVNGTPRYVADYYISGGRNGFEKVREGDKKTPVGVYHVTSSMPREKLTDFYGTGAFPINYPNEWDRRQGRDGHGIWLHGTPSDTFSRAPRSSDGCVVLTNQDLDAIAKRVQVGLTPVIISHGVEWVTAESLQKQRQELAQAVEQWRRDWESRDTARYLSHYSPNFSAGRQDFKSWAEQKGKVNAGKTWIKVGVNKLALFHYPGKENLVVVTFEQDYASSNLSNQMRKRQYWMREGGAWKIVHEGGA